MAGRRTGVSLLTISQAAQRLQVSTKTLRAWCDKGLIPYTRLPSGYRRFSAEQIEQIRGSMQRGVGDVERERQDHGSAAMTNEVPPLVAELDALRAELMQGRRFEGSSADLINEAREEQLAGL